MSKACTSSNAAGARATRSPRWFVDRRAPPYLAMRGGEASINGFKISLCAAGDATHSDVVFQPRQLRHCRRIDDRGQVGALAHLQQVARQSKAGYIREGVHTG